MIDPLYRTVVQGRDVGLQSFLHSNAGEEGEGRADNTVRWDSPNWNGLMVTAHYTLDSDETDGVVSASNPNGEEDDDAYGIGAQYSNGGILVFVDYITNGSDKADNSHGDVSAWKVGGKYTMDNFGIYGQYEDITDEFATGVAGPFEVEAQLWHLAGSYSFGNSMVYLGYGSGTTDDLFPGVVGGTESEQTAITLAGTHNLSKRTMVYAAYSMLEQDNDTVLNGIIDAAVTPPDVANDPEADVIAIGLKHKF
jgi:predicted porin